MQASVKTVGYNDSYFIDVVCNNCKIFSHHLQSEQTSVIYRGIMLMCLQAFVELDKL